MNNSVADRRSLVGLFPAMPASGLYDRVVEEVVASRVVAGMARHERLRLRLARTGFIQVSQSES
jgi:hypothetical protein